MATKALLHLHSVMLCLQEETFKGRIQSIQCGHDFPLTHRKVKYLTPSHQETGSLLIGLLIFLLL